MSTDARTSWLAAESGERRPVDAGAWAALLLALVLAFAVALGFGFRERAWRTQSVIQTAPRGQWAHYRDMWVRLDQADVAPALPGQYEPARAKAGEVIVRAVLTVVFDRDTDRTRAYCDVSLLAGKDVFQTTYVGVAGPSDIGCVSYENNGVPVIKAGSSHQFMAAFELPESEAHDLVVRLALVDPQGLALAFPVD